jgi:sulfite exporter TauE/SafE
LHHHVLPPSGDLPLLFLASILGSTHCVGMCGPYVALCASRVSPEATTLARQRVFLRLLFNAGRLATYCAIGALVGAFGQVALAAGTRAGISGAVALFAGLVAVALGCALWGWIRDPSGILRTWGLDVLIRGGMLRAFRAPPHLALVLLGALQGVLPCALVYGAASRAAVAGSASAGAATMFVFGLGTVPAIFALTSLPGGLLRRLHTWRWAGLFITVVGILLVFRGLAALGVVGHTIFW